MPHSDPEEAKRLPFEDYVAEVSSKPASKWNADEARGERILLQQC
jgi:hypothetical protein